MAAKQSTLLLVLFVLFSSASARALPLTNETDNKPFEIVTLFVFGDSTVDPGNNKNVKVFKPDSDQPGLTAAFSPYGVDFDERMMFSPPTGRFTNGKTVADYLARLGGLSEVPISYTNSSGNERKRMLEVSGINYGSAGCGILTSFTKPPQFECFSLKEQIDFFNLTVEQDLIYVSNDTEDIEVFLSEATFFISAGANDFIFTYPLYTEDEEPLFVSNLIEELRVHIVRLHELGAREFIVNNVANLGCLPSKRNPSTGECDEKWADIVNPYNNQLFQLLKDNLTKDYTDSTFFLADSFSLLYDMIHDTTGKYGFVNVSHPCCGVPYEGTLVCIPGADLCSNRDEYLFFDGEHITQAANHAFAQLCINKTICG